MENYIAGIIDVSAGLIFLLAGLYMIRRNKRIKSEGIKTQATVIKLKENITNEGKTYTQVLEFKNRLGETIVQELNYSSSIKPKQKIPFKLPIYYLKRDNKYQLLLANNKFVSIFSYSFVFVGSILLMVFILHIFEVITILE